MSTFSQEQRSALADRHKLLTEEIEQVELKISQIDRLHFLQDSREKNQQQLKSINDELATLENLLTKANGEE